MRHPALVVCLLGSSATAAAAPGKVEVQVSPLRSIHARRAETRSAQGGPGVSVEALRRALRRRAARLSGEAISVLKRLLKNTPDDEPEKADYWFRLAEHYREIQSDEAFRARELDEPVFRARGAHRARLEATQRAHAAAERRWMLRALETYLRIVKRPAYAGYRRMDEVLFNVADMLGAEGRRDQALIFFQRLIRNHPQSRYIPDAYLSFAEHYFNAGKVEQALRLYEQVGRFRGSPLRVYALYKQGWCWLNLKDPRRALELFVQVIRDADQRRGGRLGLLREAKKDAVQAYAEVGTPARAWAFFRKIGGAEARGMLERLARLYHDQGKFDAAVLLYRQLVALDRQHPGRVCDWQHAIVIATLPGKDKRAQLAEARRLVEAQALAARGDDPNKRCAAATAGVLRELATTWHRECQVTRNLETCRLARHLYAAFLERFPRSKGAYQMAFYHAELLYKLEDWPAAATAYTRVVKMRPRGKLVEEAARAAVLSYQNQNNQEQERPPTATTAHNAQSRRPLPLPPGQRRMLEAFATYLRHVPNAPERVKILYREARTYYEHNHYERAAEGFARVAAQYPKDDLAVFAVNLQLDALSILGREAEMERWIDRYLKTPELCRGELEKTLRRLRLELWWKRAERLRQARRYRDCAELYVRAANEHQDDPRWPTMLSNAALCFEAAKLVGQAIAIRDTLIRGRPDAPEAQRALYLIGQSYHALAWYSRAADYYERFARRFPGEPEAPDALQNAIVFRVGRGEHEQATEDALLFAKSYGKRPRYAPRAAAVHFALAQIPEGRGDAEATRRHYEGYLRRWGAAGGVDRQVRAHVKIGALLWQRACPAPGVDGLCIKVERQRSRRELAHRRRVARREHCGEATRARVTTVRRDPRGVRAALSHFEQALALYARHEKRLGLGELSEEERERRTADLGDAVAQARFQLAEARLEQFLAVAFPKGLNFSTQRARSQRRLLEYLRDKGRQLEDARGLYSEVITRRSPHWAIAAAARVGQLFQHFADALYTAPIPTPPVPRQLTSPAARREFLVAFGEQYCTELEGYAVKLEDKAVKALDACLTKATELSWYNEWSRLCERELDQLQPGRSPMAAEIRVAPGYVRGRPARARLIGELR